MQRGDHLTWGSFIVVYSLAMIFTYFIYLTLSSTPADPEEMSEGFTPARGRRGACSPWKILKIGASKMHSSVFLPVN